MKHMQPPIVYDQYGRPTCGKCGGAIKTIAGADAQMLTRETPLPDTCVYSAWLRNGLLEDMGVCIGGTTDAGA